MPQNGSNKTLLKVVFKNISSSAFSLVLDAKKKRANHCFLVSYSAMKCDWFIWPFVNARRTRAAFSQLQWWSVSCLSISKNKAEQGTDLTELNVNLETMQSQDHDLEESISFINAAHFTSSGNQMNDCRRIPKASEAIRGTKKPKQNRTEQNKTKQTNKQKQENIKNRQDFSKEPRISRLLKF